MRVSYRERREKTGNVAVLGVPAPGSTTTEWALSSSCEPALIGVSSRGRYEESLTRPPGSIYNLSRESNLHRGGL